MSTTCRYCLKQFTRSDNRKRHEACHLQVEQRDSSKQGNSENDIFEPITPEPSVSAESTDTNELTQQPVVDPITPEPDMDIFGDPLTPETEQPAEQTDIFGDPLTPEMDFPEPSSPKSPTTDDDKESIDPWQEFRDRVHAVKLKEYRQAVKALRKTGLSKKVAKIRAYNEMLSDLQKELRTQYIDHLKWLRALKDDPIQQVVIDTRQKFMDEEGMDVNEATEAAVNLRKYLLNRVFEAIPEPEDDEDEDTDEDTEETTTDETEDMTDDTMEAISDISEDQDSGDEAGDEDDEPVQKRAKTLPQQPELGSSDVFVRPGYF